MEPSPSLSTGTKLTVTVILLLFLVGLGAADYLFNGNQTAQLTGNGTPEGAVAKASGPDVEHAIEEEGFEAEESDDLTLLAQVVTDGTPVESLSILQDGDRAGSVTWVSSGHVKDYFLALKDALLEAFSPQMRDLKDETVQKEGEPTRNILTFLDPTLSEERIVFVRVRERLYEFHIADGKDDVMGGFIEELSTK